MKLEECCERCMVLTGRAERATCDVEVLPPGGGPPDMTVRLCGPHEREFTSMMVAAYTDGSPAYRVDRHG